MSIHQSVYLSIHQFVYLARTSSVLYAANPLLKRMIMLASLHFESFSFESILEANTLKFNFIVS